MPLVRGTSARLGQILLNLLAERARGDAEGDAFDQSAPYRAGRRLLREARVVEVSDNGVGIAPEHVARVFDPFFTTKSSRSSTGLGLAISKRLAAEIGGELSFESVPKRGTTFRLTLAPAQPDEGVTVASGSPARAS